MLDFNDAAPILHMGDYSLLPEKADIATYLDVVFSYCDGFIPLRGFMDNGQGFDGKPNNTWMGADKNDLVDAVYNWSAFSAGQGMAAYLIPCTVANHGEAHAVECLQSQVLVCDIDNGEIPTKLAHAVRYIGTPTMIVESGGKTAEGFDKVHAYWKIEEAVDGQHLKTLTALREWLASKIGADMSFKRISQPIRIAGSVYHKNARSRLVTIRAHNPIEYRLDDLVEKVRDMPSIGSFAPAGMMDFNPTGAKLELSTVLTATVNAGGEGDYTRFDAFNAAAGHEIRMAHQGRQTVEQAYQNVVAWAVAKMNPAWEEARIKKEFEALWNKHVKENGAAAEVKTKDTSKSRFNLVDIDFLMEMEPPEYAIEKILPKEGFGVAYGPSGHGKSFCMIDMALCMAHGKDWHGHKVNGKYRVLYIVGEGASGLGKRIQAWHSAHGLDHRSVVFKALPTAVNMLDDKADLPALMETIQEAGSFDIIIIDTLARAFVGGDENDAKDMGVFVGNCDKVRVAIGGIVIAVHHTGKNFENGARGSYSLKCALDFEFFISRINEGKPELDFFVEKMKDGEDRFSVYLRMVQTAIAHVKTGEIFSTCVIDASPMPDEKAKGIGKNQRLVMEFLAANGPASWSQIIIGSGVSDGNLKRAVDGMISRGLIAKDEMSGLYCQVENCENSAFHGDT